MSAITTSHRLSHACTHRLAGARAPLRSRAKSRAGSPLPPRWRAPTAALKAASTACTARADARRTRTHLAATPALDSNPHSPLPPPAPSPMARGFLPRGLSDAYRRPR